jgi:1-acyl-sn-glycerol-3-phosphate acyltransferase
MRYTIFDTPVLRSIMFVACSLALKLIGWQKEGTLPGISKYVMIAAPHTSNIDLPITLFLAFAFRLKVYWMGKDRIFKKPFGTIMKWLGGIPVDRKTSSNIVAQSIDQFNSNDSLVMVVAPEGSRDRVNYWKTGFYHIARGAGVPIVLGYLDYRKKKGGIGPIVYPGGNIEKDMIIIQEFYKTVTARYPEKTASAHIQI